MRIFRLLCIGIVCSGMLFISGCGDGKNVTGTLTITAAATPASATTEQVVFTITYTNPYVASVGGVEVGITTSGGGSSKQTLNDNGTNSSSFTLTYLITRDPVVDQTFAVAATTGDLFASAAATIPHQ